MRKIFRYIWILGITLVAAACSSDEMSPDVAGSPDVVGETFDVTLSVDMPDLSHAGTRGIFGDTPGTGLKLTLLEFAPGNDAATSFITNVYNAETLDATNVANGGVVRFKVTLNTTSSPRRLHLMIAGDYVTCGYGSEATLLPSITQDVNHEAYWGQVEFPDGYSTTPDADGNSTLLPEVKEKLTEVPVVRNFARVTVTENLDNFELYGFELINVPTRGTIAPWSAETLSVPRLIDESTKSMLPYSVLSSTYRGILPAGCGFTNQEGDVRVEGWDNGTRFSRYSRYLYEHPFESSRHTYLIVKGVYNRSGVPTYYKLDIGNVSEENGVFSHYNILRNISYDVVINGVSAAGAPTVADAIDGVTFNNISADTRTNNMPSVSDGENMLIVGTTSVVFVEEDKPFDLTMQYITDVTGSKTVANDRLQMQWLGEDDAPLSSPESGEVVKSVTQTTVGDQIVLKVTPKKPTPVTRLQKLRITDGNGLQRVVTFVLRVPWDMSGFLVQGGILNVPTVNVSQNVGTGAGYEFTLYFNLPDGIPESVFPLQFQIEANPQNIENNPVGTLTVATGPSLFDPNVPAISYVKTVTYNEYLYKYRGEIGSVLDIGSSNADHRVRCRFRTIVAGTGTTRVKIFNVYFNSAETTFVRN